MITDAAALLARARAWIDGDPDPETRAELERLIEEQALAALEERLQPLAFGTAGLRAAVGAGPGRMNVAVVRRAAFGIAKYLKTPSAAETPLVVVGFDARPTSRAFAEASAGVLLAAGLRVVALTEPAATPLCAFLGRRLGASATIVVTASHNPRGDNGYKVYGADAVQIISPADRDIARQIEASPPARLVPMRPVRFTEAPAAGLTLLEPAKQDDYFKELARALPAGLAARDLSIVHSALHGVGTQPMRRALSEAGFRQVAPVAAQAAPDGSFPTTPFPNPEEPGTLDLALAEGRSRDAALVLVSDPDADRLAAAARLAGELTPLDGNQVGALLADFMLARFDEPAIPLVVSSVVSSPLIGLLAAARGAHHARTLTGFKWLWHAVLELERNGAGRFCFACEEALGYSVFPAVRDKDGISAGRALAELAAELAGHGLSLFDRLHQLYCEHGLWASSAHNLTLSGDAAATIDAKLDQLASRAMLRLGDERVVGVVDYRQGALKRQTWLGKALLLELTLESGGKLFVRPSGTEPKLKLYGHLRREITPASDLGHELAAARKNAAAALHALAGELGV